MLILPPRCANTYYPLAGDKGSRLLDMVVPRPDGGDGQKYLLNRWGKELFVPPAEGRWAVTLNEVRKKKKARQFRSFVSYFRFGALTEVKLAIPKHPWEPVLTELATLDAAEENTQKCG